MEKRALIAVVLSLAVLIGYQFFVTPPKQQPIKEQKEQEAVKKEEKKEEPQKQKPILPAKQTAQSQGREITIDTELYSAVLSSTGGTIKKWELKKYKDKDGLGIMLQSGQSIVPALSIGSQDNFNFSNVNFRVSGTNMKLDNNSRTGSVIFEYTASGYSIKRTYTFYSDSYKFDLKDEVKGLPEYWITVGSDFGIHSNTDGSHTGPVLLKEAERIELEAKKIKDPKSYKGKIKWIAQEDKYFFSSIVPLGQVEEAKSWTVTPQVNDPKSQKQVETPVIALRTKADVNSFLIYAGPKEHDVLKKLNIGLEHIIDFGFFSIISRPLFWLLKIFYNIVGNYGWAIVLITIITRIPFIPLINKSQKSMKKMQEIQPKVQELREKYKNDPKRMQQEMMAIYKKHKVNPIGGCLPMLLQIPVFFALYSILSIAIELRHAPFIFWIVDLSVKDPYYVLPIIMGITMLIQQKMTPSSMDPMQAKIMMFMPIIFTVMFINFASGLVLYWLVNNILSIIQQFFVNKKLAQEKAEG
ncbi:MAG: membrane protein insertase YidC [Nitrospiraceae bacterium]|nr:membrane protein insertase YidC [Nitrospiraceae bacterium]